MSADDEVMEPVRLQDDPNETPSFRDALAREKTFRVDYDEAKGLARFNAALAADEPSATLEHAPARAKWPTKAPAVVGLALLVVGAGVGLSWLGDDERAVSPAMTSTAPVAAAPPGPEAPESQALPTLSVDSLPAAPPAPPPAVARSTRAAVTAPAAPPAPPPSAPAVVDPLEETRHLGALRRVAGSDPEKALSMVADGNRRFAGGSFREERDAIAVDALARLGRGAEAKRAATTFLTTYPTSPLAPSVRRAAGL